MHDVDLYATILGIVKPWKVTDVRMDLEANEIEVEVTCTVDTWACPECQTQMAIKEYNQRRWRHLDSCQFKTYIVCNVPRVTCDKHGSQTVRVPWADERSRFTLLFERLAIDVMKMTSQKGAARILGMTWDQAEGIKERAVRRGLERKKNGPPQRVCFDEKAVAKGHTYATVVVRLDNGKPSVDYIAETREQKASDGYWQQWTRTALETVESVAMDMWQPFADSVRTHVPGGASKIVYDGFHLVGRLNKAVDLVRRSEHAHLSVDGNTCLKGTRYWWLYGYENIPQRCRRSFKELLSANLKTGKAWSIKETFRAFYDCSTVSDARSFFNDWYRTAIRSRLEPIMAFARSCKKHLENILTHFVHHLSNAHAESMNSNIGAMITKARGYRSFERLKRDLLFHHGGLELYPKPYYATP